MTWLQFQAEVYIYYILYDEIKGEDGKFNATNLPKMICFQVVLLGMAYGKCRNACNIQLDTFLSLSLPQFRGEVI